MTQDCPDCGGSGLLQILSVSENLQEALSLLEGDNDVLYTSSCHACPRGAEMKAILGG